MRITALVIEYWSNPIVKWIFMGHVRGLLRREWLPNLASGGLKATLWEGSRKKKKEDDATLFYPLLVVKQLTHYNKLRFIIKRTKTRTVCGGQKGNKGQSIPGLHHPWGRVGDKEKAPWERGRSYIILNEYTAHYCTTTSHPHLFVVVVVVLHIQRHVSIAVNL